MDKKDFYKDAVEGGPGPLDGLLVVESATTWAGPLAAMLLGDYGATVIKVEEAAGDVARRIPPMLPGTNPPLSFVHATVNRNKRSIVLDLHASADRKQLLELLGKADVFIHSFRPGVLRDWGLGYDAVHQACPRLVYVSISGYGQYGCNAGRAGYDPLAQAISGFMHLNGAADGPPTKAPTFLGDDFAGLHAALGAMAALWERQSHGEGQHVDVALTDAIQVHTNGLLSLGAMGVPYPRFGSRYSFAAPADVYRCKDGFVYCGVLLDSHWDTLARMIGQPELSENPEYHGPQRLMRRDEVESLLSQWLADRTVAEAVESFTEGGLMISPVNDLEQAAGDPHLADRDMLQELDYADGQRIPVTGPAVKLSRTKLRLRTAAPSQPGEHTDKILREFDLN